MQNEDDLNLECLPDYNTNNLCTGLESHFNKTLSIINSSSNDSQTLLENATELIKSVHEIFDDLNKNDVQIAHGFAVSLLTQTKFVEFVLKIGSNLFQKNDQID